MLIVWLCDDNKIGKNKRKNLFCFLMWKERSRAERADHGDGITYAFVWIMLKCLSMSINPLNVLVSCLHDFSSTFTTQRTMEGVEKESNSSLMRSILSLYRCLWSFCTKLWCTCISHSTLVWSTSLRAMKEKNDMKSTLMPVEWAEVCLIGSSSLFTNEIETT